MYIYTLFRRYVYLLDHHSGKIVFLLNGKRIPPVKRIKKRLRINFLNTSVNKHQLFFKLIFRAVELTYPVLNISKKKFCRQSFPYLPDDINNKYVKTEITASSLGNAF